MMAITVAFPDKAIIAALGPFKIEIVRLTAVVDGNEYTSRLSQPIAAFAAPATDAGAGADVTSCVIGTGTDQKVVTIHDPTTAGLTLFVIGF
jgi:hypothetical protein